MTAIMILLKSCATPPASWPTPHLFVPLGSCALWVAFPPFFFRQQTAAATPHPARRGEVQARPAGSPGRGGKFTTPDRIGGGGVARGAAAAAALSSLLTRSPD